MVSEDCSDKNRTMSAVEWTGERPWSKASFLYLPAAYVRRRYNQASDGLVACCDAEVPGCVAVRFAQGRGGY